MPLLPDNLDMTDKDFDALRGRLIALIQSVFPDWTDFAVASFGNILLELYAFVGDVILYYLDNQARESRLVTATQRKNVIALAALLGYRLPGASAATAEVVFSLVQAAAAAVRIPAGTVVRTREVTDPIRFQLLTDLLIAFDVVVPVVLTDIERRQLRTIVDYLRPAQAHFVDLVEPRAPAPVDHWELRMNSRLDFYFRQRVTEAELDLAFALLEQADRRAFRNPLSALAASSSSQWI